MAHSITFPEGTWRALDKLAQLTNVRERAHRAKLVQDALRAYEWILYEQANGRTIVALEDPDMQLLEQSHQVDGDRDSLISFVDQEKLPEARSYFSLDQEGL
ncbi:MAG: hypothetical protein KGJ86_03210 [Chloroflexota bacterium]|nr:hypothetical protein [Chloroflexota bacterium]